ncbi:MAG: hypothetical protein IT537_06060 [Hyphomicrobiales bacterium]|nr:hypothetical protein [Hyphomicrobiales bacterium]
MRCMVCGGDMALVAAVVDQTMVVTGYERHTLRCAQCGEEEQRLVFRSSASPRVTAASPTPPGEPLHKRVEERTGVDHVETASGEPPARLQAETTASPPVGAWARAIKKLRDQQEELRERAKLAVASREAQRFTRDWTAGFQSRAPELSRRARPGEIARRMRSSKLNLEPLPGARSKKWAKVIAKIDGKQIALDQVRVITRTPAPSEEFDRIWDGREVAPPAAVEPAPPSITPPSRSTSLVPLVDESAGLWARAVAMLQGCVLR